MAISIGALSVMVSFFFAFGAVILAVAGLIIGIWSLSAQHRGMAMIGLLMCCLALALGSFLACVEIYEAIHGYPPWAPPVPPVI